MPKRITSAVLLVLVAHMCLGQAGSLERSARKLMAKHHWHRAKDKLYKALEKDSTNAAATFLLASYFFTPDNPDFSIDSAYRHVSRALSHFTAASDREIDRLKRIPVDTAVIIKLRTRIDSAAFARAHALDTENAYLTFLRDFPFAADRTRAMELRDDAAYRDATRENTYQAFLRFYEKYPSAKHAEEALSRYHLLLFEARTGSGTLKSYEDFLSEYPSTPYRTVVEKNIFEISTAGGAPDSFLNYLQRHPGSRFARRARDIFYHICLALDKPFPETHLDDSLRNVAAIQNSYMVPVLDKGEYAFMNEDGRMLIRTGSVELAADYLCGNVTEDVVVAGGKIIARDGTTIYSGDIQEIEDLGFGFLKVYTDSCIQVVHKSSTVIDSCVDDARVVAGRFIAVQRDGAWSLITFGGKVLADYSGDEIGSIGEVVIIRRGGAHHLTPADAIARTANREQIAFSEIYDNVKMWLPDMLLVRKGTSEALLNQELTEIIPAGEHRIAPAFFGATVTSADGVRIMDLAGTEYGKFPAISITRPWVISRKDTVEHLLNAGLTATRSEQYDSVFFIGPFAAGIAGDSVTVHFNQKANETFHASARLAFLPGKDSLAFLVVNQEKKKTVFNHQGIRYFSGEYDGIDYAGEGYFQVRRREKKGLVQSDGTAVLPVEYDALGAVNAGVVSLLRAMKFGAFNIGQKKLIKPQFEKNVVFYNASLLGVYEKGRYKFIDWNGRQQGDVWFDEVRYWTDTLALLRHDYQWELYNTITHRNEEQGITVLKYIQDTDVEKLAMIRQDGEWGVLSSKDGLVIPPSFTSIINVGSPEKPMYFTVKHVEEASIHVVIYYDATGKMLLRMVYEEDDYSRIVCPNK